MSGTHRQKCCCGCGACCSVTEGNRCGFCDPFLSNGEITAEFSVHAYVNASGSFRGKVVDAIGSGVFTFDTEDLCSNAVVNGSDVVSGSFGSQYTPSPFCTCAVTGARLLYFPGSASFAAYIAVELVFASGCVSPCVDPYVFYFFLSGGTPSVSVGNNFRLCTGCDGNCQPNLDCECTGTFTGIAAGFHGTLTISAPTMQACPEAGGMMAMAPGAGVVIEAAVDPVGALRSWRKTRENINQAEEVFAQWN